MITVPPEAPATHSVRRRNQHVQGRGEPGRVCPLAPWGIRCLVGAVSLEASQGKQKNNNNNYNQHAETHTID